MNTTHTQHHATRGNTQTRLAPWLAACAGLIAVSMPSMAQESKLSITEDNCIGIALSSRDPEQTTQAGRIARQALAIKDANFPVYHLTTLEGWGDPFGLIAYRGVYHCFPYGNQWLHFVSEDLVRWRDWPVALKKAENGLVHQSGATFETADGKLNLIMSMGGRYRHYWSDDAFLTCEKRDIFKTDKAPARDVHDCQVWQHANTWYLFAAGYPATIWSSPDLQAWTCHGPMVDAFVLYGEVTDFQSLGQKHILTIIGGPVGLRKEGLGNQYWLGTFDYQKNRFVPEHKEPRYLDGGRTVSFKLANLARGKGPDRIVAMAAIRRNATQLGPLKWQSPLTLPRQLSLVDGVLHQEPVAELESLRGKKLLEVKDATAEEINQRLANLESDTCEIVCTLRSRPESPFGFLLRRTQDGEDYLRVYFDPTKQIIGDDGPNRDRNLEKDKSIFTGGQAWLLYYFGTTPVYSSPEHPVTMRIFLDRSVCESFVNGAVHTTWCPAPAEAKGLRMFGSHDLQVKSLEIWEMNPILNNKKEKP